MSPVLEASAAGFLATLPMSAAMQGMFRELPWAERGPLPPRQITQEVLHKLGVDDLSDKQLQALTMACHFGYGAAAGGLYGALVGRRASGATAGMLFGLGLWGASYLGLMPGLAVLPSATRHPAGRNALMIAAHLVWGGAVGLLTGAGKESP